MKPFSFLFIALVALFSITVIGCEWPETPPAPQDEVTGEIAAAAAMRSFLVQAGPETMTNADTVTTDLGTFYSPIEYQIASVADSLSGATAGNTYLEWDADGDGANFVRIETMVVNGVQTRAQETGTIVGGALRLRTITTGTQSTRIWHEFWHTPRVPE